MPPRVAFYGGCALDVADAAIILERFADEIVFCDIRPELLRHWRAVEARTHHQAS